MSSADFQITLEQYGFPSKAQEYVQNHHSAILRLLSDHHWHSIAEISKYGGKQYNARIYELRQEGYNIVNVYRHGEFGSIMVITK
jgi:hypothetical protein